MDAESLTTPAAPGEAPTGTTSESGGGGGAPSPWNLPNAITTARLVLAGILFALIRSDDFPFTAAVLFVVAAASDALDGWIARRYGMVTKLGRILDPFVDKIIVCGAFVFLLEKQFHPGSTNGAWSGVDAWMVTIVIGREMFVTGLRSFLETEGKDFSASLSGKLKMLVQCVAITASLLSLGPDPRFSEGLFPVVRDVLLWTAVAVTVWSGLVYVHRAWVLLRPAK